MKTIQNILSDFPAVSLEEAQEVKLMNRIDRKYWFHLSLLPQFLKELKPFCDVLEVEGKRVVQYQTTYLDTDNNEMYINHHNGKLARFKVRRRKYETSEMGFFEIKRKTNKKVTKKRRIETEFSRNGLMPEECEFLEKNSPYGNLNLHPALSNKFYRITLITKCRKDRCTIDFYPRFWNKNGEVEFRNLVIFELKRGSRLNDSPVVSVVKKLGIRQRGLSKYCTGRALLTPGLKKNAFKSRLRFLENKLNDIKTI